MTSLVGQTLNRKYRVISRVGAGSMGTVYLAEHVGLKKKIALKVLHPDLQLQGDSLQRFQQEGIAAGRFSHPNAIQIFDFDEVKKGETGLFYLAMEYVEGTNLKSWLTQNGPLDIRTAVDCTRQILATLSEAHRQNIVHRDLKPENIMMIPNPLDGGVAVKVLDFGISKLIDIQRQDVLATQTGRILGTPLYMSPEQCLGQTVDERSDLYAVGLILREMLIGKPPFDGDNVTEILIKHTSESLPSPKVVRPELELPKDLEAILEKSLEKDREHRFSSANEMSDALGEVRYDRLATGRRLRLDLPKARQWGLGAILVVLAGVGLWASGALNSKSSEGDSSSQGQESGVEAASAPFRLSERPSSELSEIQVEYVSTLGQIENYLANDRLTEAQTLLDRAFQMSCRDGEFFLARGWFYVARGDLDAAEQDFRSGIESLPGDAEGICGLGWLAIKRAEWEEARTFLDQALTIDQHEVRALVGLGVVFEQEGDLAGARDSYQKAVDANSESALAHLYFGKFLRSAGDPEGAVTQLVAAKRYGRDPQTFVELGRAYQAMNRAEEAEKQWTEALSLDPSLNDLRIELAAHYLDRQLFTDAESQIVSVLSRDGSRYEAYFLRACLALANDRQEEAIDHLRDGLSRSGFHPDSNRLLAILIHQEGRLDEAIRLYDELLKKDPDDLVARANSGLVLLEQRLYEESKEAFEQVLDRDPKDLVSNLNLAYLYLEYLSLDSYPDAFDRARECLKAYVDAGGEDPRASSWLASLGE